jgi:hypothetical protein
MIAAIERFVFNYLYKYDSVSIDIERIIDISDDDLRNHLSKLSDAIEKEFDRILPVFEEDHEVILVEIDRNLVKINGKVIITFKSILAVYPLTEMGRQLLSGKLNNDFKISLPKFVPLIEKIKKERYLKNRENAATRIFSVFEIKESPNPDFIKEVRQIIASVLSKDTSVKKSFLYHLITYDKTPSFLPPGNAEFFAKVGLIAHHTIGKNDDVFKNGTLYKACVFYKDKLNTSTPSDGLNKYYELPDEDLKNSHNIMIKIISENHTELNIFKIAYFFLAMKSYLLKNDNNLALIYNNIIEELEKDKTTTLHVLYLIGYTFSFEQLYEGLHTLDRAPLLESKFIKPKSIVKPYDDTKITTDYVAESEIVNEQEKKITRDKDLAEVKTIEAVDPESEKNKFENESIIEIEKNNGTEDIIIVGTDVKVNDSEEAINHIKLDNEEENTSPLMEERDNNLENKAEIGNNEINLENETNSEVIQAETIEKSTRLNDYNDIYTDIKIHQNIEEGKGRNISEFKKWILGVVAKSKIENWKEFFNKYFPDENKIISSEILADVLDQTGQKKSLVTKPLEKSIYNYFHNK